MTALVDNSLADSSQKQIHDRVVIYELMNFDRLIDMIRRTRRDLNTDLIS